MPWLPYDVIVIYFCDYRISNWLCHIGVDRSDPDKELIDSLHVSKHWDDSSIGFPVFIIMINWRHMSAVTSHLCVSKLFEDDENKLLYQILYYWPLVIGIDRWQVGASHEDTMMSKAFLFHGVMMLVCSNAFNNIAHYAIKFVIINGLNYPKIFYICLWNPASAGTFYQTWFLWIAVVLMRLFVWNLYF